MKVLDYQDDNAMKKIDDFLFEQVLPPPTVEMFRLRPR